MYSAASKERVCNSYATCTLHTISHGTTQLSIHLFLVQEFQAERVICKGKGPGQTSVFDATVDCVRACFEGSPQKSMHAVGREL